MKWLRLAAEQGHAQAQLKLGVSYGNGQGVAQNYQEAVKWFRLAAKQGQAKAQYYLSLSYANELGVIQNDVRAYMWSNLASDNGQRDAQKNLENVAQRMTPAQIAEAQKLAHDCRNSHYTNCD